MKTNRHKKNFTLRLALKRWQIWTRKWPINKFPYTVPFSVPIFCILYCLCIFYVPTVLFLKGGNKIHKLAYDKGLALHCFYLNCSKYAWLTEWLSLWQKTIATHRKTERELLKDISLTTKLTEDFITKNGKQHLIKYDTDKLQLRAFPLHKL